MIRHLQRLRPHLKINFLTNQINFMFLPIWLILTLLAILFVIGLYVAWNNPKKKFQSLIDDEISKAKQASNTALQYALNTIKAKL
jgi:hypothetical protein